jgi:hypothetical protein
MHPMSRCSLIAWHHLRRFCHVGWHAECTRNRMKVGISERAQLVLRVCCL